MRLIVIYVLFALSGFSALIYELLFTYYLKLFLGHSSYSQTLVLAVFMGGLTIGSFLIGYFIRKIKDPAFFYILVEVIVGLYAIFFDPIFRSFIDFSYRFVIPDISEPLYIDLYRIISSTILIIPQFILLGTTFPLISSFLFKLENNINRGKILASLYFTNTIGGVAGIFLSGFILLDYLGLRETITLAGYVNIFIALVIIFLQKKEKIKDTTKDITDTLPNSLKLDDRYYLLFFVAFLTGFSSFIYEVTWIRMLSLIFGNSVHSFEIMLLSFLLGLAFGGFFLSKRIENINNCIFYLIKVQVLMGFFAIATLPFYNISFDIFCYLFNIFPKTQEGYHLYNFVTQSISILIMFPATFFAGMTLPLITHILIKNGYGEKVIGYVYGVNTIGAVLGVTITIYFLIPIIGLKDSLIIGALIDIMIGIELFLKFGGERKSLLNKKYFYFATALTIVLIGYFFDPQPLKLVSGIYRTGELIKDKEAKIIYYKDGKTASISVVNIDDALSIRTNGKSDSALCIEPKRSPELDEYTVFLLGYLPQLYMPEAKSAVNIGMGTGVSSNILLSNRNIEEVYTVEIEKEVVKAGKFFSPFNDLVFKDARSKIVIDDARNFFIKNKKKYDIIISEPSNPWITGVASLFTNEFYKIVAEDLKDDGVLVQWLQLYEIDIRLMVSVFKALSEHFEDYYIYAPNDNEVLIILKKKGKLGTIKSLVTNNEVNYFLNKLNINTLCDIKVRKIGSKETMEKFFNTFDITANSDYLPILERQAPMARFMNVGAGDFLKIANYYVPLLRFFEQENKGFNYVTDNSCFSRSKMAYKAKVVRDIFLYDEICYNAPKEILEDMLKLKAYLKDPEKVLSFDERMNLLLGLAITTIPYLDERDLTNMWDSVIKSKAYLRMTDIEKSWIELFRSISVRDIYKMRDQSKKIILTLKQMPQIAKEYLYTSYLLSDVLLGSKSNTINNEIKIERSFWGENTIIYDYLMSLYL